MLTCLLSWVLVCTYISLVIVGLGIEDIVTGLEPEVSGPLTESE